MVLVSQTVVDVRAVMVELLNTFLAKQAMKGFIGLDSLTIETEVLIIYVVFICILQDSL